MAASQFLDGCRFNPTLGGTTDWTFSSLVTGYNTPAAANAVNGQQYSYRAESADLSQWEYGTGIWNSSTGVLTRATILYSFTAGTFGTSKISFSTVPQVAIVALKEDLVPQQVGHLPGEPSNGTAASGEFGQTLSFQLAGGSAFSLTNNTQANIISGSIPAGDWDVWGVAHFIAGGAGSATATIAGLSTTSATLPGIDSGAQTFGTAIGNNIVYSAVIPKMQMSNATATTIFLVGQGAISGNVVVCGTIRARRAR